MRTVSDLAIAAVLLSLAGCCALGLGESSDYGKPATAPAKTSTAPSEAISAGPVGATAPAAPDARSTSAPAASASTPASAATAPAPAASTPAPTASTPAPPASTPAPAASTPAPAASAPPPVEVTLGTSFRLVPGQSAEAGDVRVTFASVVEDSRCPVGSQCIRAGEAVVRVSVKLPASQFSHELRSTEGTNEVFFQGYSLTFEDLAPLPKEGVAAQPDKASAGFVLTQTQ